nr:ABC transporter substrate-binding protein [Sphingomonas laterariae]
MIRRLAFALLLATTACSQHSGDGPLDVSVIGEPPTIVDPNEKPLQPADAALLAATAQGLIRFDAGGQIEPGLAIRWDVSDDGLYYTFRIDDEAGIDAEGAARRLRGAIGRASRNPLKSALTAIDEIVAVTPQVVEIRLSAPRPTLLQLLAQPEMALVVSRSKGGTGPLAVAGRGPGWLLLGPIAHQTPAEDAEIDEAEIERQQLRLRGERAAVAVVRFRDKRAQAVLGGRFHDLAVARAAGLPANMLRFDPVAGLFGLAIADAKGFLVSAENRRALSMAVDRDRIVRTFAVKDWQAASTIVPAGLADLPSPATPDWIDTPIAQRRAIAARGVAEWRQRTEEPAKVRVALPKGPGARILFTLLQLDWRQIGVEAEAVAAGADADLRLIDLVAPADTGSWYLREFTCDRSAACSEEADQLLDRARGAPTLLERNLVLAEADQRLTRITAFIPIAMPMRWSLVAPSLTAFKDNARGAHPLNHLRADRR